MSLSRTAGWRPWGLELRARQREVEHATAERQRLREQLKELVEARDAAVKDNLRREVERMQVENALIARKRSILDEVTRQRHEALYEQEQFRGLVEERQQLQLELRDWLRTSPLARSDVPRDILEAACQLDPPPNPELTEPLRQQRESVVETIRTVRATLELREADLSATRLSLRLQAVKEEDQDLERDFQGRVSMLLGAVGDDALAAVRAVHA